MTRAALRILALATASALPAFPQVPQVPQVAQVLTALPGSSLTIRGSTTVGARWSCRSSTIESRVAVAPQGGAQHSLPEVRGVTVFVPVSALRCQSGPMERAMRQALRADRDSAARSITGRFEVADTIPASHAAEAHLVGGLRVAAVERGVFLHAHVERQPDGSLRVTSMIPLTLSQFQIVAPRVLFGAVRARDAITVEVDLAFASP